MRVIYFMSAAVVLAVVISSAALAADADSSTKFSITPEIGYIMLTETASDKADDAMAYGLTLGYQFRRYFRLELPVLLSFHGDENMPEGQKAELTLASATPGLSFGTKGRLRMWFFWGMGATLVNGKIEEGDAIAEDNELAFATNLRTGIDFYMTKNRYAGIAVGVMTAALEAEKLNGSKEWEIYEYYAATFRIGYEF